MQTEVYLKSVGVGGAPKHMLALVSHAGDITLLFMFGALASTPPSIKYVMLFAMVSTPVMGFLK